MAGLDRHQDEALLAGNEKGIYTLTSADLETIGELERTRRQFLIELDEVDDVTRLEKFTSILSNMKIFMRSYHYDEYLKRTKIDGYTFYDVENNLEETEGDLDLLRKASDIAFTIWKGVLKELGAAIPTYHGGTKKKYSKPCLGWRMVTSMMTNSSGTTKRPTGILAASRPTSSFLAMRFPGSMNTIFPMT